MSEEKVLMTVASSGTYYAMINSLLKCSVYRRVAVQSVSSKMICIKEVKNGGKSPVL